MKTGFTKLRPESGPGTGFTKLLSGLGPRSGFMKPPPRRERKGDGLFCLFVFYFVCFVLLRGDALSQLARVRIPERKKEGVSELQLR